MADVERILTVSTKQEEAITWMIDQLKDGDNLRGMGTEEEVNATEPTFATHQNTGWHMALAYGLNTEIYGQSAQETKWPEKQTLFDQATAVLTQHLTTQATPASLNLQVEKYAPNIEMAVQDLTEVAVLESDWDPTLFTQWVSDPAWDHFNNTTVPEIMETFAGSNPRWSGRANRAVTEARRKLTLEILSKSAETAMSFLTFVKQMKDKQLDRKTQLTAKRNEVNAMLMDKKIDRAKEIDTAYIDRVLKYQNDALDRRMSVFPLLQYYIEEPLTNYMKRVMTTMQSGELFRGITDQANMVDFQNRLRRNTLMNPAIEFMLALCGQPMYTAVAEAPDQSPWGQVAQGAFSFLGSWAGSGQGSAPWPF